MLSRHSTNGTAAKSGRVRLGVDIGGTFTDVVIENGPSRYSTKVLTTHAAPEQGVLECIDIVVTRAGLAAKDVDLIVHGTTLATNALIERRGARTAFLTTEGFRDVIEIRAEDRFEQYDLNIDLPRPLIPRKWRYAVRERVDAAGKIHIALDTVGLAAICDELERQQIASLAIGFLHSYRFPDHEFLARDIVAKRLPRLPITISSEVAPEMREYERFSTACANAYVQPLVATYLERLQQRLRVAGFGCPLNLMLSGGGLTTVETGRKFPVRLVESGPAGGAIFSSSIAQRCGVDRVVSFDMGGTTAKICLIDGGKPLMSPSFEVARVYRFKKGSGIPLRIPVIEMVEIGAGGGSVAAVDKLGRVTVGPESAGSEPGPACYGRGGRHPTVTDADLVLGRLDAKAFAGGTIALNTERASTALCDEIGAKQGYRTEIAAWAISEVVEENMANAARVHAVESGTELAGRTLIAFGGAAPLHALRLAEKIGVNRVIIPNGAGVGSAIGFLRAPISFDVTRSHLVTLTDIDLAAADDMLAEMRREARTVVAEASGDQAIAEKLKVYMRYVGQGHEISVPLKTRSLAALGKEALREAFEAEYRRVYGRLVMEVDIEILSWALTVYADAEQAHEAQTNLRPATAQPVGFRDIYDSTTDSVQPVAVYDRENLHPGDIISGPAVIVEKETSTIVTPLFTASIDPWGYIDCRRKHA
jgi:N-methylhydantoinase A